MSGEMVVQRIHTERGSHIEPPLEQTWDHLTKLRWHAAVVACDTDLRVEVAAGGLRTKRFGRWVAEPGTYSIMVGGCSAGSFDFYGGWTFLSGVSIGAEQARYLASHGARS